MDDPTAPVRVDTWLWAVRLVKTRALGADAARGGRVRLNGQAAKAGRQLRPGDRVELSTGALTIAVVVRGTSTRRVSATAAAELYEETAESRAARERHAEQRRLEAATGAFPDPGGRPTKRDRRRLDRARRAG